MENKSEEMIKQCKEELIKALSIYVARKELEKMSYQELMRLAKTIS